MNLLLRPVPAPTQGLLFIGDPHLWSQKPGRRRDASFRATVLAKIAHAAKLSNQMNLWPVFLGDLFHAPDDNDVAMLVALVNVLGMFDRKPVTLEGNHDKNELFLSENNPLALLAAAGQIEVISAPAGWGKIILEHPDGRRHVVAMGGSPYGHALPGSFTQAFGLEREADVDTALWLTHEDLAFEGAYPGSLPIEEIQGVDIVVNGHMHGTKTPVLAGTTAFFNPGNITRMSVDMAEHVPAVWSWVPFDNQGMASSTGRRVPALERHVLPHIPASEAFDFEGRHTRQSTAIRAKAQAEESVFVSIMKSEATEHRTDDATYARESLVAIMDEQQAPDQVRAICQDLCNQALQAHRQASA